MNLRDSPRGFIFGGVSDWLSHYGPIRVKEHRAGQCPLSGTERVTLQVADRLQGRVGYIGAWFRQSLSQIAHMVAVGQSRQATGGRLGRVDIALSVKPGIS